MDVNYKQQIYELIWPNNTCTGKGDSWLYSVISAELLIKGTLKLLLLWLYLHIQSRCFRLSFKLYFPCAFLHTVLICPRARLTSSFWVPAYLCREPMQVSWNWNPYTMVCEDGFCLPCMEPLLKITEILVSHVQATDTCSYWHILFIVNSNVDICIDNL